MGRALRQIRAVRRCPLSRWKSSSTIPAGWTLSPLSSAAKDRNKLTFSASQPEAVALGVASQGSPRRCTAEGEGDWGFEASSPSPIPGPGQLLPTELRRTPCQLRVALWGRQGTASPPQQEPTASHPVRGRSRAGFRPVPSHRGGGEDGGTSLELIIAAAASFPKATQLMQ